eukprot:135083_1
MTYMSSQWRHVVASVFVYICWCKTSEILTTGASTFDKTELAQNNNINKWLKENKLESLSQQFSEDDISIKDLILLKYKDVERFCTDYHMKTVVETRFIAAVKKLKGKQYGTVISESEKQAMQSTKNVIEQLNENAESLNNLMESINTKKVVLTNKINKYYDEAIKKLNEERNISLSKLDNLVNEDTEKCQNTNQQIEELENEYIVFSENWDDMLSEYNLDRDERKKQIIQQSKNLVKKCTNLGNEIAKSLYDTLQQQQAKPKPKPKELSPKERKQQAERERLRKF